MLLNPGLGVLLLCNYSSQMELSLARVPLKADMSVCACVFVCLGKLMYFYQGLHVVSRSASEYRVLHHSN